jgi:hypothetical protein
MKLLEKDIQKSIKDYLELKGFVVVKFASVGIYKQATNQYIPQAQKGVSDLLCCSPKGEWLAVEVKRPGGKISAYQDYFIQQIRRNHGKAIVAYSIDDVIPVVEEMEKN